jgi:hypothetical protein
MTDFNLEQYRLVLEVLEQMKDCLDRGETYTNVLGKPFNVTRQFGICWHVFVHTPNSEISGIDMGFMVPAFIDMGLDTYYPVESQTTDDPNHQRIAYTSQRNMYDPDSVYGANRLKLLDRLIEYYRKKLA